MEKVKELIPGSELKCEKSEQNVEQNNEKYSEIALCTLTTDADYGKVIVPFLEKYQYYKLNDLMETDKGIYKFSIYGSGYADGRDYINLAIYEKEKTVEVKKETDILGIKLIETYEQGLITHNLELLREQLNINGKIIEINAEPNSPEAILNEIRKLLSAYRIVAEQETKKKIVNEISYKIGVLLYLLNKKDLTDEKKIVVFD